jgi:hypothetical protein
MSQTETELFNLAAQILGGRGRLVTSAQSSRTVDVFQLWYPFARKQVLAAAHWPSCAKSENLPLHRERVPGAVWTNNDPSPGNRFAYMLPTDRLHPRELSTGETFTLGMVADTKCLFTGVQSPILTYTFDQTNLSRWENELFLAVAHALAAFAAMTITGKNSIVDYAESKANAMILTARNMTANYDDAPVQVVATWHAARGYIGSPNYPRYLFPHGEMLRVGASANVK